MKKALEQVRAFHGLVGASIGDVAKPDATVDLELRVRLIAEEFDELLSALRPSLITCRVRNAVEEWLNASDGTLPPHLPSVADALADLAYVTVGANVAWGIPGGEVWAEVHAANMRKQNGPKDPVTGKQLKPEGWQPPDIEAILNAAKSR